MTLEKPQASSFCIAPTLSIPVFEYEIPYVLPISEIAARGQQGNRCKNSVLLRNGLNEASLRPGRWPRYQEVNCYLDKAA